MYYFNPLSRQYYFPEGFNKHTFFLSFYHPYTFLGQFFWFFWRKIGALQKLFSESKPELVLPIYSIKNHVSSSAIMAFNRGTPGPERKITILGIEPATDEKFFIKYADTSIAQNNVINEANVLSQLYHLTFVPKLQLQVSEKDYTLIKTNVMNGVRLSNQPIEEQLLELMFQIAGQQVKTERNYPTELKNNFAHGDFCPWNILVQDGQLQVFDWEMAGTYPAGYDLFTYIFQTSFLLSPKRSIEKLLEINQRIIIRYFNALNIENWHPYLFAFARLKLEFENKKLNKRLVKPLHNLSLYAEKL